MSWNYRVMEFVTPMGAQFFEIHEVYYDENGRPIRYTENPAIVQVVEEDVVLSLMWILEKMGEAVGKPVLRDIDFNDDGVIGESHSFLDHDEQRTIVTAENVGRVFGGGRDGQIKKKP